MSPNAKYVGQVLLMTIPGVKRPQWRWITGLSPTGLFQARTPKMGVLIRNLSKKRLLDYGRVHTLPAGSHPWRLNRSKSRRRR